MKRRGRRRIRQLKIRGTRITYNKNKHLNKRKKSERNRRQSINKNKERNNDKNYDVIKKCVNTLFNKKVNM